MAVAMARARRARGRRRRRSRSPASTTCSSSFLEPTFEELALFHELVPVERRGLARARRSAALIAIAGIGARLLLLRRAARASTARLRERLRARCTASCSTSGTSTSSTTRSSTARRSRSGASPTRSSSGSSSTGIVSGAAGAVRGAGARRPRRAVGLRARLRAAADRRLRGARRLLPGGERELSAQRAALAAARGRARSPAGAAARRRALDRRSLGALVALGLAIGLVVDFDAGRRRAPARRRRDLDPRPRRPLPARRRRDQRLPGPADRAAVGRGDAVLGAARRPGRRRARASTTSCSGSPRPPRSARSWPRTCCSSSSSST